MLGANEALFFGHDTPKFLDGLRRVAALGEPGRVDGGVGFLLSITMQGCRTWLRAYMSNNVIWSRGRMPCRMRSSRCCSFFVCLQGLQKLARPSLPPPQSRGDLCRIGRHRTLPWSSFRSMNLAISFRSFFVILSSLCE